MYRSALVLTAWLIAVPPAAAQATFARDVAPLIFEHCAPCHRPGEIGPFSLLTYRDVRQRATQIAEVTSRRLMPPWKPQGAHDEFIGARVLRDDQIDIIRRWVADGAVEGDPSQLPPAPHWTGGWQLGAPDLIVAMPDEFVLGPGGGDVFRTFVIPIPTTRARYVKAVEFHPGNARAVHHANFGVDRTRSSRRLDLQDAEPGYTGGMVPDAAYPPGHMLGWTPGQRPRPSPEGAAWRLEADSDLVVQLHMQPTGKPEPVRARMGFYFTDEAPVRTPVGLRLGSQTIDIPPGTEAYVVSDTYRVPVDVEVHAIQPHAHNLARRMAAAATLPDGRSRPLIAIDDWDFRWQEVYRYARPVVLPRGTTVSMRFTYDNSEGNARNPHRPPRRVVWGQNTADEMGDLWIQMIPVHAADLAALSADVERKRREEDLAGYSKVLRDDPRNPLRHDAVAMLYLQAGRPSEAAAHFRDSLRLNPDSAPTHYNLGIALSMQRQLDEALVEFREAVRLDPQHAEAHNNLGAMLHVGGNLAEAEAAYRRAAALAPNAESHNNLGRILSATGRDREAIAEFRRALDLRPDLPSALAGLAWVLATARDTGLRQPAEAVQLAERAQRVMAGADPAALDALAAAYAAAGDFGRAVPAARAAADSAARSGLTGLADEIRARLALYESGRSYTR